MLPDETCAQGLLVIADARVTVCGRTALIRNISKCFSLAPSPPTTPLLQQSITLLSPPIVSSLHSSSSPLFGPTASSLHHSIPPARSSALITNAGLTLRM